MIPSPDGRPVPDALPKLLDFVVLNTMKHLHRALEASRDCSSAPSVMEWYRLVGYALSDGNEYQRLALGAIAAHMQSTGVSSAAIARYLQCPQSAVPALVSESAREMYAGLVDSPDPYLDGSTWCEAGRDAATSECSAARDRVEVTLAALFHDPEDPDALKHLPDDLREAALAISQVLNRVLDPA